MNLKSLVIPCAIALAGSAIAQTGNGQSSIVPSPADLTLIASAMRAAPVRVAESATIIVMDTPGAPPRTLRQGSNGFTCMPDNPTTPGPDPMCMDRAALDWVNAWIGRRIPTPGSIGFVYMLQGGTDASNIDPYAERPTGTNEWIETGPHVMIVGAPASFYAQYPRTGTPDTRAPFIMWPGTPYEHLMIPLI